MSSRFFSFWVVLFYLTYPLGAMQKASLPGRLQITADLVGVRTFKYEDNRRHRPIVIELWYPTEQTGPIDEPSDQIWVHPKEIRDPPFPKGVKEFPLVVMSHGHRGDRREESWLADQLVHSGYIVAAVDHYGNTRHDFNLLLSLKFWERARDISFAIDRLLSEPLLSGRIDRDRIGFVGYSLGGMTGLGLAGATVGALDEMIAQVMGKHRDINADEMSKVDLEEAKQPLKDARIRAMLLICPASFAYQPESLRKIKIPIGLVAAINDEVLPYREHAFKIIKHLVPAKLKMMRKEISHYAFLNRVSEEGKKILHKHLHNDPPCCDRLSIHREVGKFAAEFFREFL